LPLPQGQVLSMSRRMTTLSPDGQSLAYIMESGMFVRRFAQFEADAIPVVDLGQATTSPTFSPDGAWLAFHSGSQGAIKRVSTRGGAALRVCEAQLPLTISWDASGILLGMGLGGALRCDPGGGAAQQLVRAQEDEPILGPQLLDSDSLLFTSAHMSETGPARWDKAQVIVQSLKSGTRRVVVNSGSDARVTATGHLVYRYGGILYAVPFDARTQSIRGDAVPVIEGITRASSGATQMSLSESGTIVYMPGPTGTGSTERQLTIGDRGGVTSRVPLAPGPFVHVRVSSDGKQAALGSDDGKNASVWVYALEGKSALRRLTLTGVNRFPVWSPDGQWIAFQSERDNERGIYRQRGDGTGGPERLTTAAAGEEQMPESWSPDGKYLAYSAHVTSPRNQYALWMLSLADGKAAPFGGVEAVEPIGATFSPDGRWVAYVHSRSDDISGADRGVYVQPFPATGTVYQAPRQLVDFHPMWSSGGKELVFLASTTARQMAAMQVPAAGSGLTFGAPMRFPASVTGDRLSLEPRAFDMLPDGRLIGLVGPADAGGGGGGGGGGFAELRVVMNWFEELAQRVPVK
jgi:Tol biopolymer transport system component